MNEGETKNSRSALRQVVLGPWEAVGGKVGRGLKECCLSLAFLARVLVRFPIVLKNRELTLKQRCRHRPLYYAAAAHVLREAAAHGIGYTFPRKLHGLRRP